MGRSTSPPRGRRSSRSRSESPSNRRRRSSRSRSRSRDRDRERGGGRRSSRWSPRRDDGDDRRRPPPPPPLPPPPPPPPAPGEILRAVVRSVVPFGAFVELLSGYNDVDDDDRRRGGRGASSSASSSHRRPRPLQALVHSSLVSEETSRFSRDDDAEDRQRAISFFAPVGSTVFVKVVDVQTKGSGDLKISASMRSVSQEDGRDLDPEGRMTVGGGAGEFDGGGRSRRPANRPMSPPGDGPLSPFPPAVGSVLRARVASATKFGAFVLLEGWGGGRGLVHITQIAEGLDPARLKEATDEERQEAVASMLPVGSELFVKVVDVSESAPASAGDGDGEGGVGQQRQHQQQQFKVSCSAKVVDQETGRDLDPNNERTSRGKGGAGANAAPAPSTAGAVTGDAVVQWGHLAAERYKGASGKDYDLVEETAEEAAAAAAAAVAAEEAALEAERRAAAGPPPPPPPAITSVEDALAILEQLEGGGKKRKDKKRKKEKKRSKKEKKSRKKHRRRRRSSSSSTSSGSSSDSD